MEQRIFDIIFDGDEVTWQSLVYDLVRVEHMDPWDIDVSALAHRYIEMLKQMKEADLRISGKVVLAAAIMLKLKSEYLIGEDMDHFDRLMHPEEYTEDALYEEHEKKMPFDATNARLIPKTPQPRKRKVSIYELVEALKQALEVKKRRRELIAALPILIPERKVDISKLIDDLYEAITKHVEHRDRVLFSELVPSENKKDVITMFLPLLHLSNARKIDLEQQVHFGEIEILIPEEGKERTHVTPSHEAIDYDKKHDFIRDALDESEKPSRKRK